MVYRFIPAGEGPGGGGGGAAGGRGGYFENSRTMLRQVMLLQVPFHLPFIGGGGAGGARPASMQEGRTWAR